MEPIRVRAPDGSIIEFPEGTDDATINSVMAKNFGGPGGSEAPIDKNKPRLQNADGSYSTEQTITVEADGKFYNIPTIVNGKRVGEDEAYRLWVDGSNPEVGSFSSQEEAVQAAQSRSDEIGNQQPTAFDRAKQVGSFVVDAFNPLQPLGKPIEKVGDAILGVGRPRFSQGAAEDYVADKSLGNRAKLGGAVGADTLSQMVAGLFGGVPKMVGAGLDRPVESAVGAYEHGKQIASDIYTAPQRLSDAASDDDPFSFNRELARTTMAIGEPLGLVGGFRGAPRAAAARVEPPLNAPRLTPAPAEAAGGKVGVSSIPDKTFPPEMPPPMREAPPGSRVPYSRLEQAAADKKITGGKYTFADTDTAVGAGYVQFSMALPVARSAVKGKMEKLMAHGEEVFDDFIKNYQRDIGGAIDVGASLDREAVGDIILRATDRYTNQRTQYDWIGTERIKRDGAENTSYRTFRDRQDELRTNAYKQFNPSDEASVEFTIQALNKQRNLSANKSVQAVIENENVGTSRKSVARPFDEAQADINRVGAVEAANRAAKTRAKELENNARAAADELDSIAEDIARANSGVDAQTKAAFERLQLNRGLEEAGQGNVRRRAEKNYVQSAQAGRKIKEEVQAARSAADEARSYGSNLAGIFPEALPDAARRLTINDLVLIRSYLRRKQREHRLVNNEDDAVLASLISSISEDIFASVAKSGRAKAIKKAQEAGLSEAAIAKAGEEGAKKAVLRMKAANHHYKKYNEILVNAFRPIMDPSKKRVTATQAYDRLIKLAARKGGNIRAIRLFRRALRENEMDDVSAGILRQMGIDDTGAWSPATFIKRWNAMDPRAKAVLFWRRRDPGILKTLQANVRRLEGLARLEKAGKVSTGTLGRMASLTIVGGVLGLGSALTVILSSAFIGRLMVSPTFAKYFGGIMDLPRKGVRGLDDATRSVLKAMVDDNILDADIAKQIPSMSEEQIGLLALITGLSAVATSDEPIDDVANAMLLNLYGQSLNMKDEMGDMRAKLNQNRKTAASYPNGNTQLTDAQGAPIGQPEAPYQPMREQLPPGR